MRKAVRCKEEGCEHTACARGLCSAHYQRWYRKDSPYSPLRPSRRESRPAACGVTGCGQTDRITKGLCRLHYTRFRNHGDPLTVNKRGAKPIRASLPSETSPSKLGKLLGVSRQRAEQLLNSEAHNARVLLGQAVKAGKVIKPARCERCQKATSDLEAHHWDYREVLDVRWLCPPCHAVVHPHGNPYGSNGKPPKQKSAAA